MFPPKSKKQTRKRGVRKQQIAFRCPPDLLEYIEAAEEGGYSRTEIVLRMLEMSRDAADVLGSSWFEVERLAFASHVTPGTALAGLVLEALRRKEPKS